MTTTKTNTQKTFKAPRRKVEEYNRSELAGTKWTPQEDEMLINYYEDMGPTQLLDHLPGRSVNSISVRAKLLGVSFRKAKRKEWKLGGNPEEERDIIIEEIKFLINSICQDPAKRAKAMSLLNMTAQTNSAQWWCERRNKRLGHWCEMFIKGYEYKPMAISREAFLEGDGVFTVKGGSDYAFYGRNG